jgi:NAD(P)-dependent dehydrogenase (short-subunit alcohol dehydrogenase family)
MLTDRVAIITGGTGALGRAVTRHFLEQGALCAVPYRKEADRDVLLRESAARADCLLHQAADLLQDREREAFIEAVLTRFGGIDIVLNLAGGFAGGAPVAETAPEILDRMLEQNLKTVFVVCRSVIPHLKARGSGKIVTVAARAALQGAAGIGAYGAAKAGVLSLTQAMADELSNDNIQVNCILPSIIDTPANRRAMPDADHSRWVAPEQIARVLAFLASEDAAVVSGAAVPVYGRA